MLLLTLKSYLPLKNMFMGFWPCSHVHMHPILCGIEGQDAVKCTSGLVLLYNLNVCNQSHSKPLGSLACKDSIPVGADPPNIFVK